MQLRAHCYVAEIVDVLAPRSRDLFFFMNSYTVLNTGTLLHTFTHARVYEHLFLRGMCYTGSNLANSSGTVFLGMLKGDPKVFYDNQWVIRLPWCHPRRCHR